MASPIGKPHFNTALAASFAEPYLTTINLSSGGIHLFDHRGKTTVW
jgi:hypothetical protein